MNVKLPVILMLLGLCMARTFGATPATMPATQQAFVHPGLLHTEADFERMRAKVTAAEQPWKSGWEVLLANPHAGLGWRARPSEKVIRGAVPGQNYAAFFNDVHAAYQLALRWKVSGETAYADKSIEIMNAWSSTLKEVGGNADRFLASGIYGYQFANAGEIMRTYPGWKPEDFARFQNMMVTIFYPMNRDFLTRHNGAAITNYWANWDLCNIASVLAIGVLCDRRDIYDEGLEYFKHGAGNGSVGRAIYYLHPGNLGQFQESGRDQGHNTMCIALVATICEMAWNQGDDLYSYDNNRVLAGAEYVAKYNLGNDVPFQEFSWGTGQRGDKRTQTVVAEGGRGQSRPGWEILYNHYVNRRGIAAPYSTQFAAKVRPEGGGGNYGPNSGGFDQLGFGTLTATRDPIAAAIAPTGVVARLSNASVVLTWWGVANASSYNVKRATRADGPFTTIASDIKDLLTYTDGGVEPGKYYYMITGVLPSGEETKPSAVVALSSTPEVLVSPITMHSGASELPAQSLLSFNGKDDYASLPPGVVGNLADFTISARVFVRESSAWARVFDFGDGVGRYMFLTTNNGDGKPRFTVSTVYGYNAQTIDGVAPFPTGQWVHVAVTLSGRTGTLYIDGAAVATNPNIDFPPFQLGATRQNWLGRSQFERDPYLNGQIDDFRIHTGALPAEEIAPMAKQEPAPNP